MILIKNNLNRANFARIIFYLLLTISIVFFYALYEQYELLTDAKNGIAVTHQAAISNQMHIQIISVINIILLCTSIIVFLMWIYRAYDNLTKLNITTLNFTPGWAVGFWFVPILSLVNPYTAMREIWEETQNYTLSKEQKQNLIKPTLVRIWWALYLTNIFVSYFVLIFFKGDSSIDGLLTLTTALMVSNTFTIAVKIVTLVMINKIAIFEKNLWDFANNSDNLQINSVDVSIV
jgi:hypothetical protein